MVTLIPVAAIVAIFLFLLKEAFEFFRRAGERRRKRTAIKELLKHEVSENYRALNFLFHAIDATERETIAPAERDTIVVQHAGRLRYDRIDTNGSVVSGNPLPVPRMTEFNRLLQSAAELDKTLYSEIRKGYEHVFQIEHLYYSFVDYLTGRDKDREMWFDGFRRYAWDLYDEIDKGLREFYVILAGSELQCKALRRSPSLADVDTGPDTRSVKTKPLPELARARPLSRPFRASEPDEPAYVPEHKSLKDDYYIVDYQHIDDFRCIRPLSEAIGEGLFDSTSSQERKAEEDALRAELTDLFTNAGWEGDGEINCIFIPPCFTDWGDTWCQTVYHVKQSNDGTSWLAVPRNLRLQLPEGFLSRHE
jgi:hypothetical protein